MRLIIQIMEMNNRIYHSLSTVVLWEFQCWQVHGYFIFLLVVVLSFRQWDLEIV